ncbi:MAG: hypothetical protein V1750_11835 [Acidobacteriota bacterium]
MNDPCREVARFLEETGGERSLEVAAHLKRCPACSRQAALVSLLDSLAPEEGNKERAAEIFAALPPAPWQLRRPLTWLPAAASLGLVAVGLGLLGPLPGGSAVSLLPGATAQLGGWLLSTALDLVTAVRGSADAARVVLAAGGGGLVMWLVATALGGSLAVAALARPVERGRKW